jgi:hypothetical protein
MGTDCPFNTLGVGTDATGDEIKAAYRARLKLTHPDHGGDRGDLDRVVAAYQELRRRGALERRRPRADPYARSLRGLDEAAGWEIRPYQAPARKVSDRFAELLQVELRRQSTAA